MKYRTEEGDEIRLIQEISYKGRTLLTWYNLTKKLFSLTIFNYRDQPNVVSKLAPLTNWGYPTYNGEEIDDHVEASTVATLFIEDVMYGNYWWEKDEMFVIPEETWQRLEDETGEVRPTVEKQKPRLRLVKEDE